MTKTEKRQQRVRETLEAEKYNLPGCPPPGRKPAVKREKLRGSHHCRCGLRISANNSRCAKCAGVAAV